MKRTLYSAFGAVFLVLAVYVFANYYSVIFATTISGRIIGVQKVNETTTIVGTGLPIPSSQIFSFSVAIRSDKGEILTGSTEDRQWAVAREGMCVRARFFPYPFWDLQKSGTYFNVRMIQMFDCPQGYAEAPGTSATLTPAAAIAVGTPTATPTPNVVATPTLVPTAAPTPVPAAKPAGHKKDAKKN